jgi:DNA-binding CsgD family transcriptional regulator
MVRAKWTLVDQFERDGKRYLLAVRSEGAIDGMELLSPREREVVVRAARGLANKAVAVELGIATSTVSVLLSRATAKLGAGSRKELLEKLQGVRSY